MNKNKGFTLIELLVVIAIIVILASIVLVGIQSATKKAKDARIIADISQIRTQQEIAYSSNNAYVDESAANFASTDMGKLVADIKNQLSSSEPAGAPDNTNVHVYSSGNNYCAYSILNEKASDGTTRQYQCVDSTGAALKTTAITCSATVFTCVAP